MTPINSCNFTAKHLTKVNTATCSIHQKIYKYLKKVNVFLLFSFALWSVVSEWRTTAWAEKCGEGETHSEPGACAALLVEGW